MSRTMFCSPSWQFMAISVVVLATMIGCGGADAGPKVVPVSGKVLFKGQPLAEAQVAFLGNGKTQPAVAITDGLGHFVLTTSRSGDGAVPGEHTVTVSKTVANPSAKKVTGKLSMEDAAKLTAERGKDDPSENLSLIPEKYSMAAESGLKFTVKEGQTNEFTIDLKD